MIKAVFLDVDNTLLDFQLCSRFSIRMALADFGMEDRPDIFPVFGKWNLELWEALERGEIDRDELYRIRWNIIFREVGIDLDGIAFEQRFLAHLAESCETVEGANDLVKYLADRYPVYITSNASQSQQVKRLTAAGMMPHIREVFTSEQIGFSKPDVRFFEGCIARVGNILPEEIILIGDSLTADIAGGIAAGLKTLWFDYGGTGSTSPADYSVTSLSDIKNYI